MRKFCDLDLGRFNVIQGQRSWCHSDNSSLAASKLSIPHLSNLISMLHYDYHHRHDHRRLRKPYLAQRRLKSGASLMNDLIQFGSVLCSVTQLLWWVRTAGVVGRIEPPVILKLFILCVLFLHASAS